MNKANTRRTDVLSKLKPAGRENQHIAKQVTPTFGRIVPIDDRHIRKIAQDQIRPG
jgi:hypothetical protein